MKESDKYSKIRANSVCSPLPKSLTLFMTKICKFSPLPDKQLNSLFMTGTVALNVTFVMGFCWWSYRSRWKSSFSEKKNISSSRLEYKNHYTLFITTWPKSMLYLVFTGNGAIRSSENQTDGVGGRTLILLMTPSLMIKWKLHYRSRKQKRKNKPMTMFDSGLCDWLGLPLLLPTPTTNFLRLRRLWSSEN